MLSLFLKARADTIPGEDKQRKIFGTSIVTFETEVAHFQIDIAPAKRPEYQTAFIKINALSVILLGKESYT